MNTPTPRLVRTQRNCRALVAVLGLAAFFTSMARVSAQVVVFSNNLDTRASIAGWGGTASTNSSLINFTNGYAQFARGEQANGLLYSLRTPVGATIATNVQSTGFTVSWDVRFPNTNSALGPSFNIAGVQGGLGSVVGSNYSYLVEFGSGGTNQIFMRTQFITNDFTSVSIARTGIRTNWASATPSPGDPFDRLHFTWTPNFSNNLPRIVITRNEQTNALLTYTDPNGWRLGDVTSWQVSVYGERTFSAGGEFDNLVVTIPEPSTVALLLLGAGAVLLRHRYLRRKASGAFPTEGPRH
jgi:hypothetical protein